MTSVHCRWAGLGVWPSYDAVLFQVQLYEDFSKSHAQKKVEEELSEGGAQENEATPITHIFQVSG